jgi:hypothetical protein
MRSPTFLHYKYLGLQRTYARQKALGAKLGEVDVGRGWGGQYFITEDHFGAHFAELEAACVDVSRVTEHNPSLCWWRLEARS